MKGNLEARDTGTESKRALDSVADESSNRRRGRKRREGNPVCRGVFLSHRASGSLLRLLFEVGVRYSTETTYKRPPADRHGTTVLESNPLETLETFLSKMAAMKFLVLFASVIAVCSAGVLHAVPAALAAPAAIPAAIAAPAAIPAALTVGTYASSYNAHAINHAVAAPYIAGPVVAHATAPLAAAPLAYSSYPAAYYGRR